MFFPPLVVHGALLVIEEERNFQERMNALPPEVAQKLREERAAQRKEEKEHRRRLEIAEAGRARNFWGQ